MRNKLRGRTVSPLLVAAVLLLATASAVWACTPQPRIFSLGPQVGPVGLEITLEGQASRPVALGGQTSQAPVEVRWNSLEGATIGRGTTDFNGNFSVTARIPQAEPGIYFVVVKTGDAGVVRMPFEVTAERAVGPSEPMRAPDAAASTADLWSAFSSSRAGAEQASGITGPGESGRETQALAGGALLLAGLVALGSGVVLARRRTAAGARNLKS